VIDLIRNADAAMYHSKQNGGNSFAFYSPEMNAAAVERLMLKSKLRRSLERDEFQVHYQPKVDLRDGRIVGAEALLRWHHPSLGAVPPGRFVPVAERSGFIVELGAWVVQEACRQAAAWQDLLDADFHVAVNLSPVQFRRGDIEHLLLNALQAHGLPAHRLEVELTESMLLEDSRGLHGTLARLRTMGIGFAIDDFGTGYSNLAYLKRFEVGRLKIDQSFVRRLTHDVQDQAIVGAIIQMASRLGLTTIAEGVEDVPTLDLLRTLGCDEGQGFHWSPALPAHTFAQRWLQPALAGVAG
jgi:EAL domain-containing protein (putative c-di-GMP-specific phosphodiesterase class I)